MTTKQPTKKGFLNYIHNFRGVAILFVVGGHILLNWEPESLSQKVINSIFQNGTVLFVFIAGYLFQYLSSKYETLDYWKKKLKFVIIPYLIVSVPAIFYRLYEVPYEVTVIHPDFGSWSIWGQIGWYLTSGGHLKPLWFIPMIFIFYLIAPVLISIDRRPKFYWCLPVLVIISILVPRDQLTDIPRMFVHFLSSYVFGMFFSHYSDKIMHFSKKYGWLLTIITLIIIIITFFDIPYYDQTMFIQKMLFCWFFIYWLDYFDKYIPKYTALLADYSFGIFFLHYYFLLVFKFLAETYFPYLISGNTLNWTIHFILIIIFNNIFISITKHIFGKRSRFMIGC